MRRSILQTKFYLLSVLLSLASCSQDELTEQGMTLPDGMYPMTFTAVQVAPENTPQTRVSEDENGMSSRWDGGEIIKVAVSGKGNGMETTCTLDKSGNITQYAPQLYWQNTNDATVNAWYSNITGQSTVAENTVSLSDQSGGLAYVLKADPVKANYKTENIVLKFSHQLAKVRVKIENGTYQENLSNATVKVKGYTSCIVTNDDVSGGSEEGYITMHKNGEYYEANLVPNTLQASEAFEISTDEKTVKASLKEDVSLAKGKIHTITITINTEGPEEITGGETITKPGEYIMKGNFTESVTLNGDGITLTLDGVTANIGNAIKVTGGSPTLIVKGTSNSFNGNGAGILISPNASVTIEGATDNASDSKLTIKAGSSNQPGIGSPDGNTCGNIIIENVTLDVTGGNGSVGGAAIGTSGNFGSGCGNIEITNSIINATGGQGAAAIGMGFNCDCGYSIGAITITNSQLTIKTQSNGTTRGAGIGLGGIPDHSASSGYQICGKITITTTESQETFFSRFDTGEGFKAGKTSNSQYWSFQQWSGITFNGNSLADGNDDGYK